MSLSQSSVSVAAGGQRVSLYREITDAIIAELEQGRCPWVQPWRSGGTTCSVGLPRNALTGRSYSGINVLLLWGAAFSSGYASQTWLTFRQALECGGHVRKGERGTTVVYADRFVPRSELKRAAETGEEPGSVPFLKRFTVFNVDQCEGLPEDLVTIPPPLPDGMILPQVEDLILASGAKVLLGGDKAFYAPGPDLIQIPRPEAFFESVNWHRTALHELAHWTGHPSRLARDFSGRYGSSAYAREELVAELATAFACAQLGVVPTVRHADYIGAWLEVLRDDDRAIIRAASFASKAADMLLSFSGRDEAARPDAEAVASEASLAGIEAAGASGE